MSDEQNTIEITAASTLPRPRIRWAGIIWGLVLAAIAAVALWLIAVPERRDAFGDWLLTLTPAALVLSLVLITGGLLLIAGLVGLIRRRELRVTVARD